MANLQLRYRVNGTHFIPQFKFIPDASNPDQTPREWEDFEYGKHINEGSLLSHIGYHLACLQHGEKMIWNTGWYFKRGKKEPETTPQTIYFLNRTFVSTFLGAVQGFHAPDNYSSFDLNLQNETPAA